MLDDDWEELRPKRTMVSSFGSGALRLSLLFGVLGIAMAAIAVPYLSTIAPQLAAGTYRNPGVDPITTATSRRQSESYTMRRSVLQRNKTDVCIIRRDGTYAGDCR